MNIRFILGTLLFMGCSVGDDTLYVGYDDDGKMAYKIVGEGLRNACYYGYYPNGELKYEFCLVDSMKQGLFREYNENGGLYRSAFLDKEQIVGADTFFRASGSVDQIVYYKEGQANGPIHMYREDGRLRAYNLVHNGDIYYIKTYSYNDGDGSVDSICAYNVVIHTNRDTFYTGDTMVVSFSLPLLEEPHGVEQFLLTYATDLVFENERLEPDTEPRTVALQEDKLQKRYLMLEPGKVRIWGKLNYEPQSVKLKRDALSEKFIHVLKR